MKYLFPLMFLLPACGSECIQKSTLTKEYSFGTLEKIECPPGEHVKSATPKYLPGGEVITHIIVQCEAITCEGV